MAKEKTVVKKVENAIRYSDGTVRIDNVRGTLVHVFEKWRPADKPEQEPKYTFIALLNKKTHKAAKDLLIEIRDEFYKEKNKGAKLAADRVFLRDGDADGAHENGAGCWVVSSSETKRPAVRGPDKSVWNKDEHDERVYSGAFYSVIIRPWWMDNKWGKRVNCGVVVVQFIKDGERFGDFINPEDAADNLDSFEDAGGYDGGDDDL